MMLRLAVLGLVLATTLVAEEGRTWRIMPIGDSITEGGSSFAVYRLPLAERLAAAGYRVTFVGSRVTATRMGPLAHEGYGGKNAEYLAMMVPPRFREHPADIVLIHAGHNHTVEEHPVPGIVAATEAMIGGMRSVNPRVIVLLAQVIPSAKLPKYSYQPELNLALADLAGRLHRPEAPVVSVDLATGFDPVADTVADRVHPNPTGAGKMADRWFAALVPWLATPPKP